MTNNHNFADWKLTQLLPKNNPNEIGYRWYNEGINICLKLQDDACSENQNHLIPKYIYNRDAYTWEDIRLYLLSKGFEVFVSRIDEGRYEVRLRFPECTEGYHVGELLKPFPASDDDSWIDKPSPLEYKEFSTYEEAREEGIKWCLTMLKNNNEK